MSPIRTVEELLYQVVPWLMLGGIGVIGWLLRQGFKSNGDTLTGVEKQIIGLRTELRDEREDRITSYGKIMGQIERQRAVCDERHGRRDNRVVSNDGSE